MTRPTQRSLIVAAGMLGAALAAVAWLGLGAARDPRVPFLLARSPAHWITDPAAPNGWARPEFELTTVFRRTVALAATHPAGLDVRCFTSCRIEINGTTLELRAPTNWKDVLHADPGGLLRTGPNELKVEVSNADGPPALWFALTAGTSLITTDTAWSARLMGAPAAPAALSEEPPSARLQLSLAERAANPSSWAAARGLLPLLLGFALITDLLVIAARAVPGRASRAPGAFWGGALVALALVLVGALLWNNRSLDSRWGFDSGGHEDYVRTILEKHHLPLADEGWEMYQPPLYYAGVAALLWLSGHHAFSPAAIGWLRAWNALAFVVQSWSLLVCLRLLVPRSPWRLLGGLCVGLFIPCQIYLLQYPTNEVWAAALSSLAVALCLRALRRLRRDIPEAVPVAPFLLLGVVLGLALLTKFSALLPLAVILAVLSGRLVARGARPRGYLRTVGAVLVGCALACGWHYARVTLRFGQPLIGNWNRATGYAWWQDPGEHTAGDMVRFGQALSAPLWSAFHSVPDALYSTLWGDGLIGGSALPLARPPWNYGLMAAGYLLALFPSVAILLGAAALLWRLPRRPRAEDILLLGLAGGTLWAIFWMSLRVPSYAQGKAFYGLLALVPLCVFAGRGIEMIAGGGRRQRRRHALRQTGNGLSPRAMLTAALLGTWAWTAIASYWLRAPDPGINANLDPGGFFELADRATDPRTQIAAFSRVLAIVPNHPIAWIKLGDIHARLGELAAAEDAWGEALRINPASMEAHLHLARTLAIEGRGAEAAAHLRWARDLGATPTPPLPAAPRSAPGRGAPS